MYMIRFLEIADAEQVLNYHKRNYQFHREWSPIPPPNFFSVEYQRRQLEHAVEQREREEGFRFGIFALEGTELLAGRITLTAIERNAFQNGRLGYSMDARHRRQGIMTQMVRGVMGFAFDYLRLHRVEANVMPRNLPSQRILEKCGFRKVGFSPNMIFINGKWEDHDMYMALVDDFKYQRSIPVDSNLRTLIPLVGR